jgi:hypothetical protein
MKSLNGVIDYLMTNMGNLHTLPTSSVHFIVTLVLFASCQVVELAGDVVYSSGIRVLVGVIIIKAPPTIPHGVALLVTYMAGHIYPWCGAVVATSKTMPPSWRRTATTRVETIMPVITTVVVAIISAIFTPIVAVNAVSPWPIVAAPTTLARGGVG